MRSGQRVWTLVEVRGGPGEWRGAEEAWNREEWDFTDEGLRGAGWTAGVLTEDPLSRIYAVEVRVGGAAPRAEREAEWAVARLADVSAIEMYPRMPVRWDRDRELLPRWRVLTTDHRPPEADEEPSTWLARRQRQWRRRAVRLTEWTGRYDTGETVLGSAEEALALARTGWPHRDAPRTDVAVRPLDGRDGRPTVARRTADLDRRLTQILGLVVLTGCGAAVAKGTQGPVFWLWVVSAATSFCIAWWLGGRLEQVGGETIGRLLVALLGVYVVGVFLGWSLDEASGLSRAQALLLPVFVAVAVGMSLLVRSWTSSTHIAWVGPAVVAVLVPVLAVTGRLLHWMYGDELGLSTSEMDVSGIWQAASALKLLTPMSALLLVPSAWAIARHWHLVRHGGRFSAVVFAVVALLLALNAGSLGLESPQRAADAVKAVARQGGGTPPSYFGVEPEWICLTPTVPETELNTQGGILKPRRPYVTFGTTQDAVVVWDADHDRKLLVPVEQVRTTPADTHAARASCRAELRD
ncbi:hypothetical protein [Streptomyces lunaelactis]|uniref:hypothetical protein n=1 Tax=Streptomyces lunaelactis TaxID=1535768 RepID=UPI00131F3697|nr:hypothetical protein [Streptomyces lunaelactis]NUK83684.1 hypothetical protein [Streptomyces lunaelactis]